MKNQIFANASSFSFFHSFHSQVVTQAKVMALILGGFLSCQVGFAGGDWSIPDPSTQPAFKSAFLEAVSHHKMAFEYKDQGGSRFYLVNYDAPFNLEYELRRDRDGNGLTVERNDRFKEYLSQLNWSTQLPDLEKQKEKSDQAKKLAVLKGIRYVPETKGPKRNLIAQLNSGESGPENKVLYHINLTALHYENDEDESGMGESNTADRLVGTTSAFRANQFHPFKRELRKIFKKWVTDRALHNPLVSVTKKKIEDWKVYQKNTIQTALLYLNLEPQKVLFLDQSVQKQGEYALTVMGLAGLAPEEQLKKAEAEYEISKRELLGLEKALRYYFQINVLDRFKNSHFFSFVRQHLSSKFESISDQKLFDVLEVMLTEGELIEAVDALSAEGNLKPYRQSIGSSESEAVKTCAQLGGEVLTGMMGKHEVRLCQFRDGAIGIWTLHEVMLGNSQRAVSSYLDHAEDEGKDRGIVVEFEEKQTENGVQRVPVGKISEKAPIAGAQVGAGESVMARARKYCLQVGGKSVMLFFKNGAEHLIQKRACIFVETEDNDGTGVSAIELQTLYQGPDLSTNWDLTRILKFAREKAASEGAR